jgi:hypothetical protein
MRPGARFMMSVSRSRAKPTCPLPASSLQSRRSQIQRHGGISRLLAKFGSRGGSVDRVAAAAAIVGRLGRISSRVLTAEQAASGESQGW